jgi:hypothetical protein
MTTTVLAIFLKILPPIVAILSVILFYVTGSIFGKDSKRTLPPGVRYPLLCVLALVATFGFAQSFLTLLKCGQWNLIICLEIPNTKRDLLQSEELGPKIETHGNSTDGDKDSRSLSDTSIIESSGWVRVPFLDAADREVFTTENDFRQPSIVVDERSIRVAFRPDSNRSTEDQYAPVQLYKSLKGELGEEGLKLSFRVTGDFSMRSAILTGYEYFSIGLIDSSSWTTGRARYDNSFGMPNIQGDAGIGLHFAFSAGLLALEPGPIFNSRSNHPLRLLSNTAVDDIEVAELSKLLEGADSSKSSFLYEFTVDYEGNLEVSISSESGRETARGRIPSPLVDYDGIFFASSIQRTGTFNLDGFDILISDISVTTK